MDSFVAPPEEAETKFETVCEPASSEMTIWLVLKVKLGASFTAVSVRRKLFVLLVVPSDAIKLITERPLALVAVLMTNTRLVTSALVIKSVTNSDVTALAVVVTLVKFESTSATVKLMFVVPASSKIVRLASVEIMGASLTAVTVAVKVFVVESDPSLAMQEMVAEPVALVTEVNVNVRLVVVPLTLTRTTLVSEELTVTVTLVAAVSGSLKENRIFVLPKSSRKVRLVIALIMGASFTFVTINWNALVKVFLPPFNVPPESVIIAVITLVPV